MAALGRMVNTESVQIDSLKIYDTDFGVTYVGKYEATENPFLEFQTMFN